MDLPENLKNCNCGREHKKIMSEVYCDNGAVNKIPHCVMCCGAKKVFVVCDKNTYEAAGRKAVEILKDNDVPYSLFVFTKDNLKPDEYAVGNLFMKFDGSCDVILGVGSGVINDCCKILSARTGLKYIILATAPSMDGYCSATSSMEVDGLKVSLNSKSADFIIGDLDILKNAPLKMLKSGMGDMLAKYVSICEWRLSNLINGEYYCEAAAALVRESLKKCIDNCDGLLKRRDEAVKAVFEGLLMTGAAMNYVGCSRPASGIEHYFSHIWDMRSLEFGTPGDYHGIQCGIGTFYSCELYNRLKKFRPEAEKVLTAGSDFSYGKWVDILKSFLGNASETIIALEASEHKYDREKQLKRIEKIIANWDSIVSIINEEIPEEGFIEEILNKINAPVRVGDIGLDTDILALTFKATKDIRDKYILSRLCFDLGIADEYAEMLKEL